MLMIWFLDFGDSGVFEVFREEESSFPSYMYNYMCVCVCLHV